jgi:nitrous oxidase accessory protein
MAGRRATRGLAPAVAALLAAGALARPSAAATVAVPAGDGLQQAIAAAAPGDVLRLAPGLHRGRVVIDKPLTLEGEDGAVVDGGGAGQVIRVAVPDVVVRRLVVRGSGRDLPARDAGIFLDRPAARALIEDNRLENNLIGIDDWGAPSASIRNNLVVGLSDIRRSERGNGVQLWNAPGSVVEGNDIRAGRDGIFVNTSRKNAFRNNTFHGVRFAIHYMYTQDSEVSGNLSVGNDIGFAIMYSDRLVIRDNVSDGDRDHGLLLNSANSSEISGNVVRGGEKCVFIYSANKNRLHGNLFRDCAIGIHFTAGSERNTIYDNAFINNRTQVMYVGTRFLDWSAGGRGNYWSDNPAFDLDGDGIADTAYRPNDVIDQVVWRAPQAKLLLNSPAVQVVRWAQSQFPALHPGGVVDSAPLMTPPPVPAAARLEPKG